MLIRDIWAVCRDGRQRDASKVMGRADQAQEGETEDGMRSGDRAQSSRRAMKTSGEARNFPVLRMAVITSLVVEAKQENQRSACACWSMVEGREAGFRLSVYGGTKAQRANQLTHADQTCGRAFV